MHTFHFSNTTLTVTDFLMHQIWDNTGTLETHARQMQNIDRCAKIPSGPESFTTEIGTVMSNFLAA